MFRNILLPCLFLCGHLYRSEATTYTTARMLQMKIKNQSNTTSTVLSSNIPNQYSAMNVSFEKELIKHIRSIYSAVGVAGRPVRNVSQPVLVYFGMGLVTMDILERDNMLTIAVWNKFRWNDEYLKWDPNEFGNLTEVKLPSKMIWMPDIELYNTASTERLEREVLAVITYDGNVTWFPHRIFHSSCAVDVKNFPFDNQTCHLWFGSWTHPLEEVDMELEFPEGIDLSTFKADFKETAKWDIMGVDAEKLEPTSAGKTFAVLAFTLHLQRRMTFSSYILTLPVVFMSFLTLLVFWLPSETTDKSNVGLAIFGSLLLLLLILLEAAPPTVSAVPMLGVYYCFNIVIVMLSIFLSSIVSKLVADTKHCRMNDRVPACLRKIFVLAPFLGLTRPQNLESIIIKTSPTSTPTHRPKTNSSTTWDLEQDGLLNDKCHSNEMVSGSVKGPPEKWKVTVNSLCKTLSDYIRKKKQEEALQEKKQAILEEWRHLAAILDRIFLITYVIVILLSLAILFPK